jgi:hypothetical protein
MENGAVFGKALKNKNENMKIKHNISFLLAGFLLFTSVWVSAQSFTGGITEGVSTTSVKISNMNSTFTDYVNGTNIMGFEGGLYGRLNLGPFFIKPMLLVSYESGK